MRLRLAPFEKMTLAEALGMASAALRAAERSGEPVLVTSLVSGGGSVLGALQRRGLFPGEPHVRRSTGPRALIASQAFHHVFALPSITSLASDATPHNLLNRYVRGFLRGYGKLGVQAQYFGREYFCVGRRPCALLGYDVTAEGSVLFEAFAGLDAAVFEPSGASSEPPVTLREALGKLETISVAARIHQGFAEKWQLETVVEALAPEAPPSLRDAPGEYVRRRVPIGWLEAAAFFDGESALVRLAGDVLCSRSAVDALESRASAALLAGRDVDPAVLAPLAGGPLDGATIADVEAVLGEAFRRARAA